MTNLATRLKAQAKKPRLCLVVVLLAAGGPFSLPLALVEPLPGSSEPLDSAMAEGVYRGQAMRRDCDGFEARRGRDGVGVGVGVGVGARCGRGKGARREDSEWQTRRNYLCLKG